MKQFGLLSIICLMAALLLLTFPAAYAFEATDGDNSAMIETRVTGTALVQFAAGNGPSIEVSARGAGDTNFHFTSTAGTVFTIDINGNGKAYIEVTGFSELNITIKGPSEVYINAGDEVTVNVEANEEPQVFINE